MKHTIRRAFLLPAILPMFLAAIACSDDDGPTALRGRFDQRVTLRAGQAVTIESEGILIGFEEIKLDSRCPINAICVHAGEARGLFVLGPSRRLGPVASFELSTLDPNRVEIEVYRVTLESVSPSAMGQPIPPGDYVAVLRIERD